MAGQDGKGEEFTEGEGTRERFAAETARHPQRPLRQVSASIVATCGIMTAVVTSVSVSVSGPFPSCVSSCRLEQEKSTLQKKLKARGVTADQVVGVRSAQMEKEIEELKKKNSDLETEIITIKYVSPVCATPFLSPTRRTHFLMQRVCLWRP